MWACWLNSAGGSNFRCSWRMESMLVLWESTTAFSAIARNLRAEEMFSRAGESAEAKIEEAYFTQESPGCDWDRKRRTYRFYRCSSTDEPTADRGTTVRCGFCLFRSPHPTASDQKPRPGLIIEGRNLDNWMSVSRCLDDLAISDVHRGMRDLVRSRAEEQQISRL